MLQMLEEMVFLVFSDLAIVYISSCFRWWMVFLEMVFLVFGDLAIVYISSCFRCWRRWCFWYLVTWLLCIFHHASDAGGDGVSGI